MGQRWASAKRFGAFYKKAWDYAFDGAWGAIGTVTTIVPMLVAFLTDDPEVKSAWPWLADISEGMGWKIPAVLGFFVLVARMFLVAPYKFYREQQKRGDGLDEYIRPKLSLAIDDTIEGCRVVAGSPTGIGKTRYSRIQVVSHSMKPIRKCTGFVTRIDCENKTVMGHEVIQLRFAPGHSEDSQSKALYGKVPAYLDVITVTEKGEVFVCSKNFDVPSDMVHGFWKPNKDYILTISVVGKGITPVVIEAGFLYTGDWDTSKLRLIRVL